MGEKLMRGDIQFIAAGAGSGKTTKLTGILYDTLLLKEARPSGVIATTFTKMAASELRERVREKLLEENRFDLASSIGEARIGTVNSVCGGLLERFAFEMGLSPAQQVLEEEPAGSLLREAIDEACGDEIISRIEKSARRLDVEDWQSVLRDVVNAARANAVEPANLSKFAARNAESLFSHFPGVSSENPDSDLLSAIDLALPVLKAAQAEKFTDTTKKYEELLYEMKSAIVNGFAAWSQWVKLSKEKPAANPNKEPEIQNVRNMAARYAMHSRFREDIESFVSDLFGLAELALERYAERKREMGVVDFVDQETLLLEALDDPTVAGALEEEIDLLMVDEFQDTSPIQLALFMKLSTYARKTYWVGDMKQAIYGFRGSDTRLMQAVSDSLDEVEDDVAVGDSDGIPIIRAYFGSHSQRKRRLLYSWRSRPFLVNLVNEAFSVAFADTMGRDDVVLETKREELLPEIPAFANWILAGKNAEQRYQSLAAEIGSLVSSAYSVVDKRTRLPRPATYGDIAILSRSNDGVTKIARALKKAGIPAATTQPGLLLAPECVLAMACLRRLSDRADTLASAEIISLADSCEPEEWLQDRLHYMSSGGRGMDWRETGENPHPVLAIIASLRQRLPVLSPREALETVIVECGLPGIVMKWQRDPDLARARLANLQGLTGMAEKYEDGCRSRGDSATLTGLLLWMDAQRGLDLDMISEPAIDAVRVMTHHAAKGLEWPIVVLMDLKKPPRSRLWSVSVLTDGESIDPKAPLKNRFIHFWPFPFGKQSSGIGLIQDIESGEIAKKFMKDAEEEEKRLLYVSMTRARDYLVLALEKETGWLDGLGSPWLKLEKDADFLDLPNGERIAVSYRELELPEEAVAFKETSKDVHWYADPSVRRQYERLVFNPSSSSASKGKIIETVKIGERIALSRVNDMGVLGNSIHACIAASVTDLSNPPDIGETDSILKRMGVNGWLDPAELYRQIQAFIAWISTRWPECQLFAEYPVRALRDNGQVIDGRIDLLLRADKGWILFDHKSNPGGQDRWENVVQEHSGQLAAYRQAIASATGEKVLESWLFLPVAGSAIRIH